MDELARLKILYSEDKINKLKNQKIMLFGLGGVGGYVLETLARSGISSFIIIDGDIIEESNINRQIIASQENIGESKVIAFKKRLLAIWKFTQKPIIKQLNFGKMSEIRL